MEQIAGAAANGLNTLWDIGAAFTILLLTVIVLMYVIRALLLDAKEERALYRQTLKENTEAFNRLTEVIRVAISK